MGVLSIRRPSIVPMTEDSVLPRSCAVRLRASCARLGADHGGCCASSDAPPGEPACGPVFAGSGCRESEKRELFARNRLALRAEAGRGAGVSEGGASNALSRSTISRTAGATSRPNVCSIRGSSPERMKVPMPSSIASPASRSANSRGSAASCGRSAVAGPRADRARRPRPHRRSRRCPCRGRPASCRRTRAAIRRPSVR